MCGLGTSRCLPKQPGVGDGVGAGAIAGACDVVGLGYPKLVFDESC